MCDLVSECVYVQDSMAITAHLSATETTQSTAKLPREAAEECVSISSEANAAIFASDHVLVGSEAAEFNQMLSAMGDGSKLPRAISDQQAMQRKESARVAALQEQVSTCAAFGSCYFCGKESNQGFGYKMPSTV